MINVPVPVKPYIKNYIEASFGTPVLFTRQTVIGKYFLKLVEDGYQENDKKIKLSWYRDVINVQITERVQLRHGWLLTPTGIVDFNTFVEGKIKDEMLIFIYTAVTHGKMKKRRAYDLFVEEFGLSFEAFNYEMIKKSVERSTMLSRVPKKSLRLSHK